MTYLIIGIIFFLCLSYIFLMIFFPEWVGMSGEVTEDIIEEHKAEKDGQKDSINSNQ